MNFGPLPWKLFTKIGNAWCCRTGAGELRTERNGGFA